jgi:hypothetical protein
VGACEWDDVREFDGERGVGGEWGRKGEDAEGTSSRGVPVHGDVLLGKVVRLGG